MNIEIIPINDNAGVRTVNARELHTFLAVGKDFSNWIKDRIQAYGFEEGKDFTIDSPILANQKTFSSPESASKKNVCSPESGNKKRGGRGGHNIKEYHLTMDMAKELSMVERTHHGKLARQYFIACEKRLVEELRNQSAPAEFVGEVCQARLLARVENPMERAVVLDQLRSGQRVLDLVDQLGSSQSHTYRQLVLLKLSLPVQDAVRARNISVKAASYLAPLAPSKQAALLKKICNKKLSERDSISLIRSSR